MKTLPIALGGNTFELAMSDFEKSKKEVNMGMTVDASANYATNATEYFRKAMIGEERTRSRFRQLLGVKDRVKLGTIDASALNVVAGTCAFTPGTTTVKQKEFTVQPLMLPTDVCIRSLEIAFMSDQLSRGSNSFTDKFAFMDFFYDYLGSILAEQIEKLTFTGTVGVNGVDGLEAKMTADANILKPTGGNGGVASAITSANVVAKLTQARNVLPNEVKRKSDFVYIVARNVYEALMDDVSTNKASGLYFGDSNGTLTFQGVEIYCADGASNNVIIATYWYNLVNVQDLTDDELGFNVVDFMKTTLDRKIGVRCDFKFQPDYSISNEIYFHKF